MNDRRKSGGTPNTIAIVDLLQDAGFDTPAAIRTARRALESAGLTNPRKQGIASYKRQAARDLLANRFALVCGEACLSLAAPGRTPVISRKGCEVCGGSNNRRAMLAAGRALKANGVRRVLIVGGKEEQHREIARTFSAHDVAVHGVVGTALSHSQKDAVLAQKALDGVKPILKAEMGDDPRLSSWIQKQQDAIDDLRASKISLMPGGQLQALSDQQIRDLFAYLRSTQPLADRN